MCEFSEKLVTWMDGELPGETAAMVEAHIEICAVCRERMGAFQEVSSGFLAYRDAVAQAGLRRARSVKTWWPIAVTIAAALALVLLAPRRPGAYQPQKPLANARASVTTPVALTEPRPEEAVVKHKPLRRHRPIEIAAWMPEAPAVPIAISADALFAPGAIPDGIEFRADLSIAADGSPQGIRLHP